MALNGFTLLTFQISNPNSGTALTGIDFTDTLPAGLLVATPNGLTGTCGGGSITATAGSGAVGLSAATLAAGASCSFTVDVSAIATGVQNNTTSAVSSTEGGGGKTASASITVAPPSQQPPQPTDITPLNGEVYYVLNQLSGLQADLNNNSTAAGEHIVQEARSFSNLGQRWAFTRLTGEFWQISNTRNGLCFDGMASSGVTYVVQNPCAALDTQQWTLTATSNGYYTISNKSTGLVLDLLQGSLSAGALLVQTAQSGSAAQSQQWLLRPA
ncbi:MAG TPA: RICIN domain-containing protein, partial [Terriglobales bacterium]|nr:RICIN domain-containing protein [Terriglobales bacterium]